MQIDKIAYVNHDPQRIELQIHIGKNRIVRRIFSFLGYTVLELDRVAYCCLTKTKLPLGKWRALYSEELKILNQDNS